MWLLSEAMADPLPAGRYPALITIGSDGSVTYSVQATVQVPIYTLQIIYAGGSGVSSPAEGSHVFQQGSVVALSIVSGSFNNWAGDTGCSGGASHSITMDGNKRCTVTFN